MLNPADAVVYYNRGSAYTEKGELDTAIQDYNKAIELNPEFPEAYYNRGSAYTEKGELDTAIQDFSTAIDLKHENAIAYINRVWVWLLLNEWENAKADLTTAKNIGFDIVTDFHNAYGSVADFEAGTWREGAGRHCSTVTRRLKLTPRNRYKHTAPLGLRGGGMSFCSHPYPQMNPLLTTS